MLSHKKSIILLLSVQLLHQNVLKQWCSIDHLIIQKFVPQTLCMGHWRSIVHLLYLLIYK